MTVVNAGVEEQDSVVSMLGCYAETSLVDYLEENNISLENQDVITVQEVDGVKTLQVKHIVNQTSDVKVVEYSSLMAYTEENDAIAPTSVSVETNPNTRSSHSITF